MCASYMIVSIYHIYFIAHKHIHVMGIYVGNVKTNLKFNLSQTQFGG